MTLHRVGDSGAGRADARLPGRQAVEDGLLEQFLLAAEVIKGAARTHADRVGDIPRGRGGKTLLDKQSRGSVEQFRTAIGLESRFGFTARHG